MLRRLLLLSLWAVTLGVAFVGGVFVHKYRAQIRSRLQKLQGSGIIQTNLYNLSVQKLAIQGDGRDGSVAALGDGVLLVNRRGASWFVDAQRAVQPLPLRVPINVDEFDADPFNANTTDRDRFSVKDVVVQETPSGVRVSAAYMYWHKDKSCNTLRVAYIETTMAALVGGQTGPGTWRTLFESQPCMALVDAADGKSHHVTLGAGGRLAPLNERQLLLTVGEFKAEYVAPAPVEGGPVDSYGKNMLLDIPSGTSSIYTTGHRNSQGLTVGPDARVWETEHGARGGDELNLLIKGRDYGAPRVTYGTQYEMMVWPNSKTQGKHEGYEKPIYSWVPSIAPSDLIVLRGTAFPWWSGDLMVASLASQMLYRVRVEEDRVIFVEPFLIGHRIRDLTETRSGSIVLKTDDNFIVYLDNLESTPAANLDPATRGELVAGQCTSCHRMQDGAPPSIGPNLWGVVGRRVATSPGYAYSDALKRAGGTWTPERLREFVTNPNTFAPGNRMQVTTTYTAQQLDDLITYLRTLR